MCTLYSYGKDLGVCSCVQTKEARWGCVQLSKRGEDVYKLKKKGGVVYSYVREVRMQE
jgi:hypothetical protein